MLRSKGAILLRSRLTPMKTKSKISGYILGADAAGVLLLCAILSVSLLPCASGQTGCVPPPPNLVSWWPLDLNTDDIVSSNNGTWIGNPSYSTGKVGEDRKSTRLNSSH